MIFVIPAKAGIQTISVKTATQNQVRVASDKSLPPLWAYRGRLTLNSTELSLRRRSRLAPVIPAKARIQTVEAKLATPKSSTKREQQIHSSLIVLQGQFLIFVIPREGGNPDG